MARNENKRLEPSILRADREAFVGLCSIPDYAPSNPAHSIEALKVLNDEVERIREAEINAINTLSAIRSDLIAVQWKYHNGIRGAKDQVIAQYGPDSDQVVVVGLKKKSDRQRPRKAVNK